MIDPKYILISPTHVYRATKEIDLNKKFNQGSVAFSTDNRTFIKKHLNASNVVLQNAQFLEDYINYHVGDAFATKLPFYTVLEKKNDVYVEYLSELIVVPSSERNSETPVFFDELFGKPLTSEELTEVLKNYKKFSKEDLASIKKTFVDFYNRGTEAIEYHLKDRGLQIKKK